MQFVPGCCRRLRTLCLPLLGLGLAACGGGGGAITGTPTTPGPVGTDSPTPSPSAEPETPAAPAPVTVSLAVEARRKGQSTSSAVAPGDSLRSGDELALHVQVDRPAYVYVMYAGPDGAPSVLYPKAGQAAERLDPAFATRIPAIGRWLKLDKATGQENLLVFASAEPLADDALTAQVSERVAASAPPPRPRVAKVRQRRRKVAADGTMASDRGLAEVDGDGLVADSRQGGVAIVHFTIEHR